MVDNEANNNIATVSAAPPPPTTTTTATTARASGSDSNNSKIAMNVSTRLEKAINEELHFYNTSRNVAKNDNDNNKSNMNKDNNNNTATQTAVLFLLEREYEKMKFNLKKLIAAAKKYHRNSIELNKNRLDVVDVVTTLARGTPIQSHLSSSDNTTTRKNFANVYKLASKQSKKDTDTYEKDIIQYAIQWENIIVQRIDNELKKSKELYTTMKHYEEKLPSLRTKANGNTNPSIMERLNRNENKLQEAVELYDTHTMTLIVLLEEAVICSWKDLFPLIVSMMKWESNRAFAEHTVFKNLGSGLLTELNSNYNLVKEYKAVRSIPQPQQQQHQQLVQQSQPQEEDAATPTNI